MAGKGLYETHQVEKTSSSLHCPSAEAWSATPTSPSPQYHGMDGDLEELFASDLPPHVAENVLRALQDAPVEDGFDHPLEEELRLFLVEHGRSAWEFLGALFTGKRLPTPILADLLRLLGRQPPTPETVSGCAPLVQTALKAPDLALRDAAIHAVEQLGSPDLLPLLREHQEPCDWLQDYARQVVRDIQG